MATRTIAILADTGEFPSGLLEAFSEANLRFLVVSESEKRKSDLQEALGKLTEVDFVSCEREGCWEADIILLKKPTSTSSSLLPKIKEVATQKTIVVFAEAEAAPEEADLKMLLPNSRVVEVSMRDKNVSLCSGSAEAKSEVAELLTASGFNIKQ